MSIRLSTLVLGLCTLVLSLAPPAVPAWAADPPAPAAQAVAPAGKEPATETTTPTKKVKQLSPEMTERRDRVRRLLTALRTQPFNTQQNTCTDILDFCRAFGCRTELTDNAGSGQKVNGITCLCWNMPCAGYELITISEGHLAARVGYGYQNNPSELAAVLALAQVPADYPARVGKTVRTVADLVEFEKLTCRPGIDMSAKLVALATYVQEPSWKDSLGGDWTLQRVVAEELNRPLGSHSYAATSRLLGLAVALERFKSDKVPLDGDLARANRHIEDSIAYAYAEQNSDGSWGRAGTGDYAASVASTAHMLEWLVTALPANRLEEPAIVRAIDFLYNTFNTPHYQTYISTMSAREISAAMHAAYVLNVYDRRVFIPADPPASVEPAKPAAPQQTAAKPKT